MAPAAVEFGVRHVLDRGGVSVTPIPNGVGETPENSRRIVVPDSDEEHFESTVVYQRGDVTITATTFAGVDPVDSSEKGEVQGKDPIEPTTLLYVKRTGTTVIHEVRGGDRIVCLGPTNEGDLVAGVKRI